MSIRKGYSTLASPAKVWRSPKKTPSAQALFGSTGKPCSIAPGIRTGDDVVRRGKRG